VRGKACFMKELKYNSLPVRIKQCDRLGTFKTERIYFRYNTICLIILIDFYIFISHSDISV